MDYPYSISVKTQVRRLGYFSAFLFVIPKSGILKLVLYKELFKYFYSEKNNNSILKSGIIIFNLNKIPNSFSNYIAACKSLGLITIEKEIIFPTNKGLILKSILTDNENNKSFLNLNRIEKIFYFKLILEFDFYRFDCVRNLLISFPMSNLALMQKEFKIFYLKYLKNKIVPHLEKDSQDLLSVISKVQDWKSPKRYSEDIIPPRLNWGLDLGIFNVEGGKWYLLKNFQNLHYSTSLSYVVERLDSTENIAWSDLFEESKLTLLNKYLILSKKYFSTLNFPRIPLSDSICLVVFQLLKNENILAKEKEIESTILEHEKIGKYSYRVRKSAREFESYIYIKHE